MWKDSGPFSELSEHESAFRPANGRIKMADPLVVNVPVLTQLIFTVTFLFTLSICSGVIIVVIKEGLVEKFIQKCSPSFDGYRRPYSSIIWKKAWGQYVEPKMLGNAAVFEWNRTSIITNQVITGFSSPFTWCSCCRYSVTSMTILEHRHVVTLIQISSSKETV